MCFTKNPIKLVAILVCGIGRGNDRKIPYQLSPNIGNIKYCIQIWLVCRQAVSSEAHISEIEKIRRLD